jgi:chemosensory pili system protein ChpA (sensor histidine kinase/response regulator)
VSDGTDQQFLQSVFLMEAWDTLASIEDGLAALMRSPEATASVEQLRLVTHRLRGSAALNGLPQLAALAAVMEETVEHLATARPGTGGRDVEALCAMAVVLKAALDTIGTTGAEDGEAIAAALTRHAPSSTLVISTETGRKLAELDTFFSERMDVLEYFVPEAVEHLESMAQSLLGLERDGSTDSEIATLFRAVHTLKGAAYTVGCGMIGDLAHRVEDMLGDVRDGRRTFTRTAIETVFAGVDALRLLVRSAEDPVEGRAAAYDRALALLATLPALEAEATGEPAPEVARELATRVTGLGESAAVAHRAEAARPIRPSIRVNLDRLDSLMSLVGELVIARSRLERHLVQLEQAGDLLSFTQSRMTQTVAEFESKYASRQVPGADEAARPGDGAAVPLGDVFTELEFDRYDDFNLLARRVGEISSDLTEIQLQLNGLVRVVRDDAGSVQRLSGELRGHVTRARLVPIGRLFARFARQVREGARSAGKTIVLEVRGETVEMDTAIVQQMVGPLLHLVRNAINHGIETEEERRRLGKSSHGTIHLGAAHTGGSIYLEVVDDGRGIDIEAVAEAALRAGFVTPESLARLGEREVLDLIFLPGLTTAPAVTSEAGRGVGMDVVRTNVSRLGGEIEVQTAMGRGTRFRIKLPLTIAISDVLKVRVGSEVLAVPVSAVRSMVQVSPDEIHTSGGVETVEVEGEDVDLVRLDRLLGLGSRPPGALVSIVVLRTGRKLLAVAVDELLAKEEIVVKGLGPFLQGFGPFSGASVVGDGGVMLLLDPLSLLEMSSVAALEAEPNIEPGGRHALMAASSDDRPCVLLVDDSVSVRKFVGGMLERAGFRVAAARDGADALEQLAEQPVSVVVTDLEMPRVNGYELIRDLSREPATRDLPVVVLTTRAGAKHVNLARELGVEHYVAKPVDEASFVQLIGSLAGTAPARVA